MKKTVLAVILIVLGRVLTVAQPVADDTLQPVDGMVAVHDTCHATGREHRFRLRQLAVPVSLIAVGAFGIENGAMHKLNDKMRDALNGGRHRRIWVDEVTPYLPVAAAYGLDLCGLKARHGWKDRTMLLLLSVAISQGMAQGTKAVVHEWRPDGSDRRSFPSGHTTMAFTSAELLRMEYRDGPAWIAVAGYAMAVGTGAMRMYNDKHWLNDVLAGAGMGILGTRIAYWIYPWVQRCWVSRWSGRHTTALVMPYYDNRTTPGGGCGMQLSIRF